MRMVLTEQQRRSRARTLALALGASLLLLVALVVAAVSGDGGWVRWSLLVAALVPLTICLIALRGIVVLRRPDSER
ncbi:MAG: hypothetical protein H0V38_00635 [Sporichthyaceae bacterium]|nr:hypothetical protein [Sporichthyaceae bacterium]